jgi:hypothetical protein
MLSTDACYLYLLSRALFETYQILLGPVQTTFSGHGRLQDFKQFLEPKVPLFYIQLSNIIPVIAT